MSLFEILNETEFIDKLRARSASGKQMIPLLGGGISVQSGIPLVNDIRRYLHQCILMALRGGGLSDRSIPWTPDEPWPALDFFANTPKQFRRFQEELTINELNDSTIFKQGYGASADWRSALDFLSRIRRDGGELRLEPPRSSVIDSFFRHITAQRRPNLAHNMLAVLAGAGQIQLLLTLNFDELIEAAMNRAQQPLTTIAISRDAALPPTDTFWPDLTLLKLHGGRYGLRADDSLDVPPSEEEREQFAEYFLVPARQNDTGNRIASADLFIAGTSMNDKRLEKFLYSILETESSMPPNIFWTYYSDGDEKTVVEQCKKFEQLLGRSKAKICLHQTKDVGLLLLHYYQCLTASLPCSGVIRADPSNVPWPPSMALTVLSGDPVKKLPQAQKYKKRLVQQLNGAWNSAKRGSEKKKFENGKLLLNQFFDVLSRQLKIATKSQRPHIISLLGEPKYMSLTSIAAAAFEELVDGFDHCLWIDIDDSASADDLFEQIRSAFAVKACADDWTPGLVGANGVQRAEELARYARLMPGRWHLFLNAREAAGKNAPQVRANHDRSSVRDTTRFPNGWLDISEPELLMKDKSADQAVNGAMQPTDSWDAFARLIDGLLSMGSNLPLTVVLIGTAYLKESDKRLPKGALAPTPMFDSLKQHLPLLTVGIDGLVETGSFPNIDESDVDVVQWDGALLITDPMRRNDTNFVGFNETNVVDRVVNKWLGDASESSTPQGRSAWLQQLRKWRFVCAMSLMRHPRHRAAVYGHAFRFSHFETQFLRGELDETHSQDDQIDQRDARTVNIIPPDTVDSWLAELQQCGLVRHKPGGFLWLHSRTRDNLKNELAGYLSKSFQQRASDEKQSNAFLDRSILTKALEDYGLEADQAVKFIFACTHVAIANWYRRVLHSSRDSFAALDALQHYGEAAAEMSSLFVEMVLTAQNTKNEKMQIAFPRILGFIYDAMLDARRLVHSARSALVSRGASSGKCRRLEAIIHSPIRITIEQLAVGAPSPLMRNSNGDLEVTEEPDISSRNDEVWDNLREPRRRVIVAAIRLRTSLFQSMSMIAREIGENPTAYKRLRQFAESQHHEISQSDPENNDSYVNSKEAFHLIRQDWELLFGIRSVREVTDSTPGASDETPQKHREELLENSPLRWIRYQRAIATTHISSRAYFDAQLSLLRVFTQIRRKFFAQTETSSAEDKQVRGSYDRSGHASWDNVAEVIKRGRSICHEILGNVYSLADPGFARELVKSGHRQLQLAICIVELLDSDSDFGRSGSGSENGNTSTAKKIAMPSSELRRDALALGKLAYDIAVRVIDHFGLPDNTPRGEYDRGDVDNREHERQRLLDEMQRLETFAASLYRLNVAPFYKEEDRIEEDKVRGASTYSARHKLASRSLDHAVAWLEPTPATALPRAIIELEAAALSLTRATIEVQQSDQSLRSWMTLHHVFIDSIMQSMVDEDGQMTDEFTHRKSSVGRFVRGILSKTEKTELNEAVDVRSYRAEPDADSGKKKDYVFAVAYGILGETAQRLQRAQKLLTVRQKSVWWVTKMWELQLLRLRSEIELGIFDFEKMPSGIRHAITRGLETQVEEIFSEVSRMLRNDTVRFARCLQLFADCVFGIWLFRFQQALQNKNGNKLDADYDKAIDRMKRKMDDGEAKLRSMTDFNSRSRKWNPIPVRSKLTLETFEKLYRHINRISICLSVTRRKDDRGN